jgi:hypothetical protein
MYDDYEIENGERADELTKISHVKEHITSAENYYASVYERCKSDLQMANGTRGSQFDDTDARVRGGNRAEFSFPVLDKYVERVLGNYNLSPFGIDYSAYRSEQQPKATLMNQVVGGIEQRSKAKAVYRSALRMASTVGYSWIHITTKYDNPEDDSLDVSIQIEHIEDYSSVLIDPLSTAVDGSDASWVCHVDEMKLGDVKRIYGDDLDIYTDEGGLFDTHMSRDVDNNSSVRIATHYEKITKKSMIYIHPEDSTQKSEEKVDGWKSKEKTNTYVKCTKIVGNKIIFEQELQQTYIPLVPVYGLPIFEDGKPQYVGIIHRAIDAQKIINYSASMAAERLALSAKANYIASQRAIGNNVEMWKNSSRSNSPVLIFNDIDDEGRPITPPMKQDTAVNVSDTLAMTDGFNSMISQVIGMPENGIAGDGNVGETAEAALLKAKASETILSTLYENLASSIEQVGRVLLQMVSSQYDTPREVPLTDKGQTQMGMVNFPEMNVIPSEYEVAVTAGPLLATQRKENLRSLLAVAQLMGPNAQMIMPEIIDSIDLGDDSEAVKQKAQMIAQMSLQAAQAGPQQAQQMQVMAQENAQMKQQLQLLNSQLIQHQVDTTRDEMKIRADLLKTQMNNESKMDMQALKYQADSALSQQQAGQKDRNTVLGSQLDMNENEQKAGFNAMSNVQNNQSQAMLNQQQAENDVDKMIVQEKIELEKMMAEQQAELNAKQSLINQFNMPGL